MLKLALTAALATGALAVAAAPGSGAAGAAHSHPSGLIPHISGHATGAPAARTASPATAFTCGGASCSGYESAIDQYFTDVAHDSGSSNNVFSVATQYSDSSGSIAYDSTFGGAYVDTTPFPANQCSDSAHGGQDSVCLTDAELQTEIAHAISVNGWPEDSTRPSRLFAIFTPSNVGICFAVGDATNNSCSTNSFCAYHDDFSPAPNAVVAYAVAPDEATVPVGGCTDGNSPNNTGADATINTISHEMNEAITDPWPEVTPAWRSNDSNGDEMADLCEWSFGSPLGSTGSGSYNQVINGHDYWLQEEYSNASHGCVPYLGGPATAAVHGSGPLVNDGGPVMHTNTVYAIYWVPTTTAQVPSSSTAPVVSGPAAVGKKLSVSNGTWVGSPTSFSYAWLRCSANATNCSAIPGAESATYTVAAADKGHELMAQVSATNAAATTPATSLPTDVVTDVPHLTRKPRIRGAAKVGKKLSVNPGRWSDSPARFRYQWLRCTPKGTSCLRISHATKSTYTLTTKDATHRLRVEVTAINAAGSSKSPSGTSAVVKR